MSYKKYKVLSSLFAEATPIEGLTIRSQFSIDFSHVTGFGQSMPEYLPNLEQGTASRNTSDALTLQVSNTINYRFDVNDKHSFNFMVGQDGTNYHYESFGVTTRGQNNNKLTNIGTGTYAASWEDTPADDYGLLSFFGRGEYNYDNRYFAEFAVRADASSRFGASNRWGVFRIGRFHVEPAQRAFHAGCRRLADQRTDQHLDRYGRQLVDSQLRTPRTRLRRSRLCRHGRHRPPPRRATRI